MPAAVKKLHMASDITELNKICSLDATLKKKISASSVIQSAERMYKEALDAINQEEKDEEIVYKHLFRSMELWMHMKKTDEYNNDPKYMKLMYLKKAKETITLLEEYKIRLIKRYDDVKRGVKESQDSIESQFPIAQSGVYKTKKEGKEKKGGSVLNGVISYNDLNLPQDLILEVKPVISDQKNEPDYYEERKFIQCEELIEELKASFQNVLVLDIRPKKDFELSRIKNSDCINIPETSITAGLSASRLAEKISPDEKFKWNQRDQYKQVVLMDWQSEEKDVIHTSPLSNLQTILLKWDPSVVYRNRPLILNGGYNHLLDMYPTFATDPNIKRPEKPRDPNQFIPFDEHLIEYPDIENILAPKTLVPRPAEVLKPKSTSSVPTFDRSIKPASAVTKIDKPELIPKINGLVAPERNIKSHGEPMEQESNTVAENLEGLNVSPTANAATKDKPAVPSPEPQRPHTPSPAARPTVPSRQEEPFYPTTPSRSSDIGEGDGDTRFEKIKFDSTPRSGGLKRSASSPNINKLADEETDLSAKTLSPSFDRSNKPKVMSNYESYSPRASGTDSIYQANNKAGRGLTGLKNLGNLCYMNSIMQCMSNTVELTRELTRFQPHETIGRRQIASEVSSLLRTLWTGDTRITSCRSLKSRVGALRQSFSTMEQQDSHEFLTILMDWLHEDLNEPSPTRVLDGVAEATGEKAWGEFQRKNHSLVQMLFYGQLKSTVTCNHCQKQSILFEPFSNLSIPLPPPQDTPHDKDRKFSLQDCLKLYLKGETITGWVCPSCKTPREATKKLDITRLPPVLIIHLKRFMSDLVGVGWCRKRMNMVDFPLSDFDMKPHAHPDSDLRYHNYNLYAVSNHYGNMDSGHYTAYCKNHLLNKWYKFDDHDVNELSPADVRSSAAYILFYESNQFQKNRMMD